MKHTYYAANRAQSLKTVKARQARLGDAYRESNKLQMRRNRARRKARLQPSLPL